MANLKAIAAAAPILNSKAAARQREAQEFQFMDTLAQAPEQQNITAAAQRIAPQMAGAVAETQAKAQAATQQALGQAAGAALQQEGAEQGLALRKETSAFKTGLAEASRAAELSDLQSNLASRKKITQSELTQQQELSKQGIEYDNKLSFMTLKQREDLQKLGGDLNDKLFSDRLKFETDQGKRRFTSARQLSDYKISNAKSQVEFEKAAREMKQQADFDVQVLDAISKRVDARLNMELKEATAKGDQATSERIAQMKADFEKRQARAKAEAARMGTIIEVGATVAGVVASIYGTPAAGAAAYGAVKTVGTEAAKSETEKT